MGQPEEPDPAGRPDRRDSDDDPGNPTVNFRGEKRSNETHVSATDPEARLVKRKGEASRMAFLGHVLMENRNGLVVDGVLTEADGYAEREAALELMRNRAGRSLRIASWGRCARAG